MNKLYLLIVANPTADWDWDAIMLNKNITEEMVIAHKDLPWYPRYFFKNGCSFKNLQHLKEVKYISLSREDAEKKTMILFEQETRFNPVLTLEDILKHSKILNFSKYCQRKEVDWATILLLYEKGYHIGEEIFCNKKVTEKDMVVIKKIRRFMNKCSWQCLSKNPWLTWEMVENNKDFLWDFAELSENDNVLIPLDCYRKYRKQLNWYNLNMKQNLTWDFVRNNPDLPWNWNYLIYQPWVTEKIADKYISLVDKFHRFRCRNIPIEYMLETLPIFDIKRNDLTVEIVEKNFRLNWDTGSLIIYKGFTLDYIVKKYVKNDRFCTEPARRGRIQKICERQDLTLEFVRENFNDINWKLLSTNKFNIRKRSVDIIKKYWFSYKRKRLLQRMHSELSLLPPSLSGGFLGGEEYRNSLHNFQARM